MLRTEKRNVCNKYFTNTCCLEPVEKAEDSCNARCRAGSMPKRFGEKKESASAVQTSAAEAEPKNDWNICSGLPDLVLWHFGLRRAGYNTSQAFPLDYTIDVLMLAARQTSAHDL